MTIYLITNFLLCLLLSIIWKSNSVLNAFFKVVYIVMTITTAYFFIMHAFPDNNLFGQFQLI